MRRKKKTRPILRVTVWSPDVVHQQNPPPTGRRDWGREAIYYFTRAEFEAWRVTLSAFLISPPAFENAARVLAVPGSERLVVVEGIRR